MGVINVMIHRALLDVRNALVILIFINLCTLTYFILLCSYFKATIQTGASYSKSGSIAPLYIFFGVSCLSPHDILSDLHLSAPYFLC
jgi:hypothetical protein